jgi:hypothetical protein
MSVITENPNLSNPNNKYAVAKKILEGGNPGPQCEHFTCHMGSHPHAVCLVLKDPTLSYQGCLAVQRVINTQDNS